MVSLATGKALEVSFYRFFFAIFFSFMLIPLGLKGNSLHISMSYNCVAGKKIEN